MKLQYPVSSILSELLGYIKIFSYLRQNLLLKNLNSINTPGYVPKDLPTTDFAVSLHIAINEYILHQRIVFIDSDHINYGVNGSFSINPIKDLEAQALLQSDKKVYQHYIQCKLKENALHKKATIELLRLLPTTKDTAAICTQDPESRIRGLYSAWT